MIFSEEYDTALWYILKSDRRNRKEIIEFIKGLPSELVSDIKNNIDEMKKLTKNGEKSERIYKSMEFEGNINYHYSLDTFFGLDITKTKIDGKIEKEVFEIMLLPISTNRVILLDNFEEEWIGALTNNYRNFEGDTQVTSYECDEREYNIIRTPIGYCSLYNKELFDGRVDLPIVKLLNLNSLPGNVTMESLDKMSLRLFRK